MIKKFKYLLLSAAIGILTFTGCSKKEIDDNYFDKEKTVKSNIESLFTGLLYNPSKENANTIFVRYWNMNNFQAPMLGVYTMTNGFSNSSGIYEQSVAASGERWEYFYTSYLSSFREMEKIYEQSGLNPDQLAGYQIFLEAGRVFLYDQTAQMIDLWGDIPFSEAGGINKYNKNINGKFDDQKDLYDNMLNDLKRISDYLADYKSEGSTYFTLFKSQDILNSGDLRKWRIYANSLRLRLAMRISYVEEAKSKAIVAEILNNPAKYPVVEDNKSAILFTAKGTVLNSVLFKHEGGIRGATIGRLAPGFLVNTVMAPVDDPRLPVMYSKNKDKKYVGLDVDLSQPEQDQMVQANLISRIDTATYSRNDKFPGLIITASEVSFFKAEAGERWGIGAESPEENYKKGIRQSIANLYAINAANDNLDGTNFQPKTPPSEDTINSFLNKPAIAFTGSKQEKLKKIATQMWVNFGLVQAYHGWAEIRRTKYPELPFVTDNGSAQAKLPPNRLLYPEKERSLNSVNFQKVYDKDRVDVKVFWDVK